MAFVYWIHLPEHTDMFSEGYIGFTSKTVEARFKKHVIDSIGKNKRNYPLHNAIRKYGAGQLHIDTLLVGSDDYCLSTEFKLRPRGNIGWNLAVGGSTPTIGCKRSNESIAKQIKSSTGQKRTPEQCKRLSDALKGKKKSIEHSIRTSIRSKALMPWENGRAKKSTWLLANQIYLYHLQYPKHADERVAKPFGKSPSEITKLLLKIKSGWVPMEDIKYVEWLNKQLEETYVYKEKNT